MGACRVRGAVIRALWLVFAWIAGSSPSNGLKIGVLVSTDGRGELERAVTATLQSECFPPETRRVQLLWNVTTETNRFQLANKVCSLIERGTTGLVSVVDCYSQVHISSLAARFGLPNLVLYPETCECLFHSPYNLYLTSSYVVKVSLLTDVISYLKWQGFGFIFDESVGNVERREAIFAMSSIRAECTVLSLNSSSRTADVARKLGQLKVEGIKYIVLWVQQSTSKTIFRVASEQKMIGPEYQWVVFSTVFPPPVAEDIFSNCTPPHALVVSRVRRNQPLYRCLRGTPLADSMKSEVVSGILEAVLILSKEITDNGTQEVTNESCASSDTTTGLLPFVKSVSQGRKFYPRNWTGSPDMYELHSLTQNSTARWAWVGRWVHRSGLSVHGQTGLFVNKFRDFRQQLLLITAKEEKPFVIREFMDQKWVYTGLAFDILNELSERLNFRYEIVEPEDRRYGAPNEDDSWNGMVGMVKRKEVAMAVGPFSITALRDTVIDYTKPFMDDSIGILTRKPQKTANLFQMMRPFSRNVWILIAVVVVLGALLLTVTNRLTPYGVRRPREDSFVSDEHSFFENLWIVYASIMEQGAVYIPIANSSRCILGFCWIFTILIISTYTANLAAFLTVADPPPSINTLTELLQQADLGVLVQDGSNLWSLFKDSNNEVYKEMWKRLQGSPSVDGLDAALPYVRTGMYAYVGDKSTLEYVAARDCHTFVVADESFNAGTYGFVLLENSPFKEAMDFYVMKMLEAGLMDNWRQKWWARADNCSSKSRTGLASGLRLDTLGGVFIVYCAFAGLATVVLISSVLIKSRISWIPQSSGENEDELKNNNSKPTAEAIVEKSIPIHSESNGINEVSVVD